MLQAIDYLYTNYTKVGIQKKSVNRQICLKTFALFLLRPRSSVSLMQISNEWLACADSLSLSLLRRLSTRVSIIAAAPEKRKRTLEERGRKSSRGDGSCVGGREGERNQKERLIIKQESALHAPACIIYYARVRVEFVCFLSAG